MTKKLFRSKTNSIIAGVCGRLGEYFGIDPIFVRLLFVFLLLGEGTGLLLYIVLWFVVPEQVVETEELEEGSFKISICNYHCSFPITTWRITSHEC